MMKKKTKVIAGILAGIIFLLAFIGMVFYFGTRYYVLMRMQDEFDKQIEVAEEMRVSYEQQSQVKEDEIAFESGSVVGYCMENPEMFQKNNYRSVKLKR